MNRQSLATEFCAALALVLALMSAQPMLAQADAVTPRESLPVPESVRRAIAAGTRDSSGVPGPHYWQLYVHYNLEAELFPESAEIVGVGQIRFRNPSPRALTEIQLRLDQNRFRPENSPRLAPASHTDGVTVTKLLVGGKPAQIADDRPSARPALTNARSTSATLLLEQPLEVGESVLIDVNWRFTVPLDESGEALRLGREGTDLFQVAQWYPRVAMLDDLNGWDTTPYTGDVEFYNPFADFNVRLRVPAGWLVGSTGVLQNPEEVLPAEVRERLAAALRSDTVVEVATREETRSRSATLRGVSTWHFRADSVSDFAWGTSSRYGWTSARALIAGREPVALHRLDAASNSGSSAYVVQRLRDDLVINSRILTPYRFPQHTLLDGPERGMEYPMLTMFGADGPLSHEVWHQWFPMTVGTDEARYAFLDEGFATFLPRITAATRSRTPLGGRARVSSQSMQVPLISPDRPEESDWRTGLYGYSRVPPMLSALADSVGYERVMDALGGYARAWRVKHPSPWDFMFFMNRALNEDLTDFWYRWIFTTEP